MGEKPSLRSTAEASREALIYCWQASLFGVLSPSARPLEISPQGGTVENSIHRKAGRFAPSVAA